MPGGGHAKAEEGVQVALLVDDDIDVPVPAHGDNPALRSLGRRVRDGDEVHVLVVGG